jgi:phosphatidylethanolamine/phosphatidyl-N-methylethanolamine N-methyltransferase
MMVRKSAAKVRKIRSHESRIYRELSRHYERIFARFLRRRIQSTIESLDIRPGAKVLEVGVGTGLSLSAYPRHAEVTGIDIAPEMLAQAQRKIDRHGWRHVTLRRMDALEMDFPDESFDYVTAFHIMSVVPDSKRLIGEILRVSKPGATIAIINHFRSEHKWVGPLVDLLDPLTRRLGWRTTIRFSDLVGSAPLRVRRRFKTNARSLFTVVIAAKPEFEASRHPAGYPPLHVARPRRRRIAFRRKGQRRQR